MRVGVVGLGIIGKGVASRLAQEGDVAVQNRSAFQLRPNWTRHETPSALADACDVILLAVPNAQALEDVFAGNDGILQALAPGKTIVNLATIGPEEAQEFWARATATGADYLDGPVLGSRHAAATGSLTLLIGGSAAPRARCSRIFEVIGERTLEFDKIGEACQAKLVFNALLGIGMVAVIDALTLADSMGLPRSFVLEHVLNSPVASSAMRLKGNAIATADEEVHFPLEWMLKDLRLAQQASERPGLLDTTVRRYEEALKMGFGREDFSAVSKA